MIARAWPPTSGVLGALSRWFDRLSSGWTIGLAVVIYAFFLTTIMPAQSAESRGYAGDWGGPDRHLFYSPDELYSQVSTWGDRGRQQYIDFRLSLDIGFALAYAAFLITITSVAGRAAWPGDPGRRMLNLLPLVPMSCDLLENALGIWLVAAFPQRLEAIAWLTTGVTGLKWVSLAVAHAVMVYALASATATWIRRRDASP